MKMLPCVRKFYHLYSTSAICMQLLPFVCKLCHLWIDCLLYSSWLAAKIAMCIYLPFLAGLRFKRNGYALVYLDRARQSKLLKLLFEVVVMMI
jgi:hypothetical protein